MIKELDRALYAWTLNYEPTKLNILINLTFKYANGSPAFKAWEMKAYMKGFNTSLYLTK